MYLLNIETVTAKCLQIMWHILVQTTHDMLEELDHEKENTMKPANDWAAKRPSEYSKRGVQEEAKAKISSSRPRGGKRAKATSEPLCCVSKSIVRQAYAWRCNRESSANCMH